MLGGIAATGGPIAVVVGTIDEIATTPDAVHAYNDAHAASATFGLAPIRTHDGVVPGVVLAGRF